MTTDEDLAAMVRDSIPESELHSFDPTAIEAAAMRRRARRRNRVWIVGAVAAAGIVGAGLLGRPEPSPQATGGPPSASGAPTTGPLRLGPGCSFPVIDITGAPAAGRFSVSSRVEVEATIEAVVPKQVLVLLDGALVVGIPGSTKGRSIDPGSQLPNPLPKTDITFPQNQLARVPLIQGQPATLRWTGLAPGDYPVFYFFRYQGQGPCSVGLDSGVGSGQLLMATIHVT